MAAQNDIHVIGNVGKEVTFNFTPKGTAMLKFSVAVRRPFAKDKTDWFDVVYFGKGAEAVKDYVATGKQVSVQGRLETWEAERKDGSGKVRGVQIVAEDLFLCGGGKKSQTTEEEVAESMDDGEDPF